MTVDIVQGIEQWPEKNKLEKEANSEILVAYTGMRW